MEQEGFTKKSENGKGLTSLTNTRKILSLAKKKFKKFHEKFSNFNGIRKSQTVVYLVVVVVLFRRSIDERRSQNLLNTLKPKSGILLQF